MKCWKTEPTSRALIMRERIASSQETARKEVCAEPVRETAEYSANTVKELIAETFAEGMCRPPVISLINLRMCVTLVKTESCA
jgi:hypothetical protein